MREGGRGRREESMEEQGREEGWRGMLMSSKGRQVILAELAREEMTEGGHSGRVGV